MGKLWPAVWGEGCDFRRGFFLGARRRVLILSGDLWVDTIQVGSCVHQPFVRCLLNTSWPFRPFGLTWSFNRSKPAPNTSHSKPHLLQGDGVSRPGGSRTIGSVFPQSSCLLPCGDKRNPKTRDLFNDALLGGQLFRVLCQYAGEGFLRKPQGKESCSFVQPLQTPRTF